MYLVLSRFWCNYWNCLKLFKLKKIGYAIAITLAVGVKGFLQARQMLAKGQDILANKTSAGGKLPVIYGTRRVGTQIIYMDTNANDSRDLYVVYALAVGECEEILGKTIELDGNPLTDSARFRDGGYIGSDKISSGAGSLNTVSQNGTGMMQEQDNLALHLHLSIDMYLIYIMGQLHKLLILCLLLLCQIGLQHID